MKGLSNLTLDLGRDESTEVREVADVITFATSSWGLGMRVFPVQKVILKAHYGIPLDNTVKFKISDWQRKNFLEFTERTYLEYLFEEGRSNIKDVDHERTEMILSLGRRSGKNYISSVVAAYEIYKLLLKDDPQKYYGLPPSNPIQIISVATDQKQAELMYTEVSDHFRRCPFFSPYTANNTMSYARFQTPADIRQSCKYNEDPQAAKVTIKMTFKSCIAKGLRGAGNVVVILDEVAHFTDEGQSSADEIYTAIRPSMAAFSPKGDDGLPISGVESRMILISSPLGRQGQFYKLFDLGMKGGEATEKMLCIQAPTWEVNPTIEAQFLKDEYLKDPVVFFTEYGGQFTDRTRGWIEKEEDLLACIDPLRKPTTVIVPRRPHFVGVDIGLKGDMSAIAIGHIETVDGVPKIILDLIDSIQAGVGRYENIERLEFDDVADWVFNYSRKFYFTEGIFDHWAGIPFEQALIKRGLRTLRTETFTKQVTSDMFRNFKDMMWDRRLVLYDYPKPTDSAKGIHCPYITELFELQAEVVHKYLTVVAAPKIAGKHDDLSDALIRMVWCASRNLSTPKLTSSVHGGVHSPVSLSGQIYRNNFRNTRASGSHSSRMTPVPVRGRGR